MYPLKFKKCFIEKVWGGRAFEDVLDMELPENKKIGESWEVSSHKNGMSYVEDGSLAGQSLQELMESSGEELLGKEVYSRFKGKFPVLIKYLDVNDRLSVQVHPSDEYALRVEKEFGKSEAWYIIDASPDAKLIMGLKEGMTKEEFIENAKAGNFDDMFNVISVNKGDCIYVKSGLVHASLEGSVVICEVQQNSDTTYRIYDFDRVIDGVKRELHIDRAADVINFDEHPEITTVDTRKNISLDGAVKEELVRCQYFNIDRLQVEGVYNDEISPNFRIYSILEGEGKIVHAGKEYSAKKGDTYFIPAGLEVSIEGKLDILKSFL
ncbi:type I phosphomannose isomerase catalytic subunit [uncultured Ilyobacter sp.]|uniref:type I phosphomannose isomerase catalytic subunit n=1 Tax=uncultured Ilyobacter sp. TaxID=544433 RepID=UPI0029F52E3B|nr:type I phosphomannose isomerase catalytic subunit [uncultured Ilyobacter sp.]